MPARKTEPGRELPATRGQGPIVSAPGADLLSEVMSAIPVKGSLVSRGQLTAPWGIFTRGAMDTIFHVIISGTGFVTEQGVGPVPFFAGDILLLPGGAPHALSDSPHTSACHRAGMLEQMGEDGLLCLRHGGPGALTSIVCGTFGLAAAGRDFLLPLLPRLIHVTGGHSRAAPWFDATLRLLGDDLALRRPGAKVLLDRLTDMLFVQVLRAHIERAPPGSTGWLRALGDPALGRALSLIHREPARPWQAAVLAREAGMSRSAFFVRFLSVVGEAPSSYLTRWRMYLARVELGRPDASLAQVAAKVGYASETAFSRAFRRQLGVSPSGWRAGLRGHDEQDAHS